jgi:septum formation inhibitor MinC
MSPNPALNVHLRDEPVATDTIYSDAQAIDCGVTSAQLFVGTKTHTADVYPIKSDNQFVNTLLDNINQCRAPAKLISDRAQVEISECVKQVLRPLHISTWQRQQATSTASEPCRTPVPELQTTVQHYP